MTERESRVASFKSHIPSANGRDERIEYNQILHRRHGYTDIYIARPFDAAPEDPPQGLMAVDGEDSSRRIITNIILPEARNDDPDAPKRVFGMLAHAAFMHIVKQGNGNLVFVQTKIESGDPPQLQERYDSKNAQLSKLSHQTIIQNGKATVTEMLAKEMVGYGNALLFQTNTYLNFDGTEVEEKPEIK